MILHASTRKSFSLTDTASRAVVSSLSLIYREYLWSQAHSVLICPLYCVQSLPHRAQSWLQRTAYKFTLQSRKFTVQCAKFTVHSTKFTVHRTNFTVHCTKFTVERTKFIIQCNTVYCRWMMEKKGKNIK